MDPAGSAAGPRGGDRAPRGDRARGGRPQRGETAADAEVRAALHRLLDRALDRRARIDRARPWRPLERSTQAALRTALPEEGTGPEALVDDLERLRLLDPPGHAHPRFFGWAIGAGTLEGAIGAVAAALTQTNAFGGAQVATAVDAAALRWTAELLGLPGHAAGVLTSGASEANLLALAAAREEAAAPGGRVVASAEAHHSVTRASRLLGLGAPLRVPARDGAMDPAALAGVLDERAEPVVAVVATAGTPASAAFDPLDAIAEVCAERGRWLHVDGAFGAWARTAPARAGRVVGLEGARSIAIDHHKALHAPYAVGALLLDDLGPLEAAMAAPSGYLRPIRGGYGGLSDWPGERALATSRPFLGLGLYTLLRGRGAGALRAEIEASYARAERLGRLVDAWPGLERVRPVTGPAVVLRVRGQDDRGHGRIVTRLQQDGEAVLTPASIDGAIALRASTLNPASTDDDLNRLLAAVTAAGRTD